MNNENQVDTIRERYLKVLEEISSSSKKSKNQKVQLVVVSKSQPIEILRAAIEAGITVFGENYAEEAIKKMIALQQTGLEWHMIGHVQSRKAAMVVDHFSLLHSLDSLKLATRLERYCAERKKLLPVLLEVNISGEQSKNGFAGWDEAKWPDLLQELAPIVEMRHLNVRGLMTMPPFFEDAKLTRPYFRRTRNLQEFLGKHLPNSDWSELSMGTSIDFKAAVEEGATYVRVGEAILGKRQTHNDMI
jgi:PLP dependent protein